MNPIEITASAIVTCLGQGKAPTLAALRSGVSGLAPCGFETVQLPTYVGEVAGAGDDLLPPGFDKFDCRNNRVAELALQADGFLDRVAAARARYGAARIGIFVGTSTSGILETEIAYRHRQDDGSLPKGFIYDERHSTFSLGAYLQQRLGLEGPSVVLSAACATTAKAFAAAHRMIEAGLCDAALVGGADSLCLTTLYGFNALCLTSRNPCKPFDATRDGISLGEGAGFVLLEKPSSNDPMLLLGMGESSDAYHMSSPHPDGLGAKLAMQRALDSAGLAPSDIAYLNLHGTATPVGDRAEDKAVLSLFGDQIACSSTKGQTGHTLGAAGIVEAILTMLSLREGVMPGTANLGTLDPDLGATYLRAPQARRFTRAMSNSFGFGGNNCSLIFGAG
ncbi:beta-ketoacyl-ACP synthase [Roseiterribacter gracilis]|uniref:Beta-ketoacyl-[acyl-carrier-protein] synthase II n=1 Tax=Roseiterribacter gracilis TaxID=2812848 RepID=A0A8S8X8N1_9PROT|nr:beta-ketoacyl-[acyl-carrier-protein] synthase II [Rhodospirillales bacterium TMPK1]